MPGEKPHPLPLRELLSRLAGYGVVHHRGRKHLILVKPTGRDPHKGPQYPVTDHGPATEIGVPVIRACLRRFGIDPDDFWK